MFSFFKQKSTESDIESQSECDSQYESESEHESDSEDKSKSKSEIFKDHIQKHSHVNISRKLYSAILSSSGIEYIEFWELQRKIDNKHVEHIFNTMRQEWCDKKTMSFYDPIHIAHVIYNDRCYVIDGQHRVCAYKKFHDDERPFNFPIYFHTVQNDEEMLELFKLVNKRLHVDIDLLKNEKLIKLEQFLKEKYGDVIRKNEKSSSKQYRPVNRPYLDSHEFFPQIRKNIFFQNNDIEIVFHKLIEINKAIRQLPRVKRCGEKKCSKETHNKAEKLNFFLGLDKDMKWLNDLK
jgi:hypothetical protein